MFLLETNGEHQSVFREFWACLQHGRRHIVPLLCYVGGYEFILFWFKTVDVYHNRFFATGGVELVNNLLRVLFILYLFWIVYTPGRFVINLLLGSSTTDRMGVAADLALSFFTGAGIWHVTMLALGFLSLFTFWIATALTLPLVMLSFPHMRALTSAILKKLKSLTSASGPSPRGMPEHVVYGMGILALVATTGALLLVKGLYPAGGHDYYTHYFYYYESVIRHNGLWPNEVWYHFYYSKGAGLYFLSILLTDPLAPQLVTFCFFSVSSIALFQLSRRISRDTAWPWIAIVLYFALYVYAPGTDEFLANGGWADFEKLHELNASLMISILWLVTEAIEASGRARLVWGTAAASAIITAIIINTTIAPYLGGLFALVALLYVLQRKSREAFTSLALGGVAALTSLGIFAINYAATGLINDQGILLFWRFADIEKLYKWGALLPVIMLRWSTTGMMANSVPLSFASLRFLALCLRLDLLWPIVAVGLFVNAQAVLRRTSPRFELATPSILLGCATFVFIVLALAAGRSQPISFFRYSSFIVPVMIAAAILLYEAGSELTRKFRSIVRQVAIPVITAVGCLSAAWATYQADRFFNILSNASAFALGRHSIDTAYTDQRAWPGRLPWGAIYPGSRGAYGIVGPNTPISSFHIHSYCMLPDCRIEHDAAFIMSRDLDEVLFGDPKRARDLLKASEHNYFLFSKELPLTNFIVRAPLFAPDNIGRYLGIRWTDGSTVLLTWLGPDTVPLDTEWLASYRKAVEQSASATSFPYDALRRIYEQLRATPRPWKDLELP